MKSSYAAALRDVLVLEGGRVDHPKDPGGRTNRGVTQRVYDGYRRNRGLPTQDVWLIADAEVAEIYGLQYWAKVRGDELPAGIDLVLFDGAVNSGPLQSIKWLQAALGGGVRVDGVLGEASLAAVRAHPDHDALIAAILDRRMRFLRALKTWSTFGRGWTKRVDHVRAAGQAIAMGSVGPRVAYIAGAEAKARIEDAKRVPGKQVADLATGAGGATGLLSQVTDQLTPVADVVPSIGRVVAILTAVGAIVAVGGLLYRRWASRRQAELDADLLIEPSPNAAVNNNAAASETKEAA